MPIPAPLAITGLSAFVFSCQKAVRLQTAPKLTTHAECHHSSPLSIHVLNYRQGSTRCPGA